MKKNDMDASWINAPTTKAYGTASAAATTPVSALATGTVP
ncbi:unnamed protein product [[Actinomadura] parvosata subsp. kistnae]|nr:unnamed protein product [Actinomadura parvosata subsp. kistnae]